MNTLHHDRLLFAMVEARQTEDAALIDAGFVPVKLRCKALLYPAEGCHVAVLDEPVGMQGFAGFYNERRLQRKRLDLPELLLQRQLVALHKLRVDSGDLRILMAAEVHHKIDTPVFLVVLVQGVSNGRDFARRRFQLGPLKGSGLPIVEYPQADLLLRVKKRAEKFFQRDV